jgi:hypothetical protein
MQLALSLLDGSSRFYSAGYKIKAAATISE